MDRFNEYKKNNDSAALEEEFKKYIQSSYSKIKEQED